MIAAPTVFLVACFTYSASLVVQPAQEGAPALSAADVAATVAAVERVAVQSGMEASAIDLEGTRRASESEQSPYRPLAVYVKAGRALPSRAETRQGADAQVRLVVEERRDHRGLRVIIRDLTNSEGTEFTRVLEGEIERVLRERLESYEVAVRRGRVGPHFYAP